MPGRAQRRRPLPNPAAPHNPTLIVQLARRKLLRKCSRENTPVLTHSSVKLTTVSPVTSLHGTLFTADPTLNLVALKTSATDPNASGNDDYHVIPISKIQSFQVVSLAPKDANGMPSNIVPITASDTKALKAREAARIRELQEVKRKTGVDVPADAQALFDALYRMCVSIFLLACVESSLELVKADAPQIPNDMARTGHTSQ